LVYGTQGNVRAERFLSEFAYCTEELVAWMVKIARGESLDLKKGNSFRFEVREGEGADGGKKKF
jgi:hypothetical protein